MAYSYRVDGSKRIRLRDFDPDAHGGLDREEAEERTAYLLHELCELQELLYAAGENGLLAVLQGMDTSGKDGVIRHVFGPLNSQGCSVASFKVPTPIELAHDFLWRVHACTPPRGQITVFNRSHYEDVLVVRVHNLVPECVWRSRYAHINHFEQLLAESGTILLKFYLHISKGEQEKRLLAREQDPVKAWKLSVDDWREREHWDAYAEAYEDVINRCSTSYAPWHIIPANRKWFRNLAVAEVLADALRPHRDRWLSHLGEVGRREMEAIRAFRRTG